MNGITTTTEITLNNYVYIPHVHIPSLIPIVILPERILYDLFVPTQLHKHVVPFHTWGWAQQCFFPCERVIIGNIIPNPRMKKITDQNARGVW